MTHVRIEHGPGFALVVCACGWREMVHSEAGIQAAVRTHKDLVHDDRRGGSNYAAMRRIRGKSD